MTGFKLILEKQILRPQREKEWIARYGASLFRDERKKWLSPQRRTRWEQP
jgi:hypothetical protein